MEDFRGVKPVIAIEGGFGVSKSVFLDSLLDGHYIFSSSWKCGMTARGIVASAEDVPNGETRNGLSEWTEIKYKTQTEIALDFSTILRRPLMNSEAFRKFNSELTDEEFAEANLISSLGQELAG